MVLPSGAVKPATYATTGFATFRSMNAAARSSASPPISPIITIASVSGSSSNARRQSMWVVPMIGSPPIPTAVEKPMSRSSYIIWYVSVPDLETRPMRPSEVMSAGMIPALDLPGEAMPGQLGPTIRVVLPCAVAYAQNSAVSCTGMPSVMTMTSGILASTASITASLVPAGGTKTTETSASVASMASATVPNTGTSVPASSTVWPALRGLVPPTTWVPALIIRAPCLRPSEPVMPCTMIRLSPVRKIAISCSRSGQLGGAPRRVVHGPDLLDHCDLGLLEYAPPLGGVVAVETDHDRPVHLLTARAEHPDRRYDPVRHRVARGDPAEDVDEHAADRRVGQHDLQAVRHDLGRGASANVEEVRRADPAELLARVGDDIESGHDQARAVADDADLAVQLDVVEVFLLGLRLQRVRGTGVGELPPVVPERRVVVERDLGVQGDHPPVAGQHQRVDLDQRGVLAGEHVPQPLGELGRAGPCLLGQPSRGDDLGGLGGVHAGQRADRDPGQCLGLGPGDFLDLDTALDRAHRQERAVGPVQQEGQVVLLRDVDVLGHQHGAHGVALDVHAEDPLGLGLRLVRVAGELYAARLAAPADLDLRLDDHPGLSSRDELGRDLAGLLRSGGHLALLDRNAMVSEELLSFVLKQVHSGPSLCAALPPMAAGPHSLWPVPAGSLAMFPGGHRCGSGWPSVARTQSTISVVAAPGVKILATPIRLSSAMSSPGMIPPPNTTMSVASRSFSNSSTRANWVMCAPDSTESPIASASSCSAAATICSGV